MSKDKLMVVNPSTVRWEPLRYEFIPLSFCLCCGLTLLGGCSSMVTEVEAKVCVAEAGKTLPAECFPSGNQYAEKVPVPLE